MTTKIKADDNYYYITEARTPEQVLILAIMCRAFKDAMGYIEHCASFQQRRNNQVSAINFLLGSQPIDYGDKLLDARELCLLATGSDYLLKRFRKTIRNKFYYVEEIKCQRLNLLGVELL